MSKKVYVNDALQILKSKKGGFYVKITDNEDLFKQFRDNLKPGDAVFLQSQEDKLSSLVENGKISEERAEELLAKTGFIKYNGTFVYEEE